MHVEPHQIVIPHEAQIRPVHAVKYLLLQSSIHAIERSGHAERYAQQMDAQVRTQIQTGLASGWAPIALAEEHYRACDAMALSNEQLAAIGQLVGVRVQETSLVTAAKKNRDAAFDAWSEVGSLHRVWGRLHAGGSVMVAKLGPTDSLLEIRGFTLNRFRYFRQGQLASMSATFSSLGVQVRATKLVFCSPSGDEVQIRVTWS